MASHPDKHRWVPPLLLCVAWLGTTWRTWLLGETYYLRDFWTNYLPARHLLKGALAHGALPLWDPWIGGGVPALPDPNNSIFYLPAWPFLVFDDQAWALSLAVDLHLLLAALGAFVLARRWLSPWAAAIAGLAFGLGGLLQSNEINVHWHFAYAWAPLWFHAALKVLDAAALPWPRRLGAIAALAAVWALQLVASEPQIVYLEGLSIPLLVLAHRGRRLSALVQFGAATLLTLWLAAPQLAAFAEALPWTDRAQMAASESGIWSAHLGRLWELVLPSPWGWSTPTITFWGIHLVNGPWNSLYFMSLYLGALAVPLLGLGMVAGWRSGHRRGFLFLGAGAGLLALASLGSTLPFSLHEGLRRFMPLWSTFRYPERFVVLPSLALAVVIGFGVDALPGSKKLAAACLVTPAAGALLAWLVPSLLGARPGIPDVALTIGQAALHTGAVAVAAALVVWAAPRHWRSGLLALLLAADLGVAARHLLATWEPPEPSTLFTHEHERVVFSTSDITRASMGLERDTRTRRAFEASFNRPNLGIIRHVRSVSGLTAMELARARMLRDALGPERTWLAFEARFVVATPRAALNEYVPEQSLGAGLELFRYPGTLSPVGCAAKWTWADGPNVSKQAVKAGHVLEGSPKLLPTEGAADATCRLERASATSLLVHLSDSPAPQWVAIRESYFPGWTARSSRGEVFEVLPADLALLGFIAPPHTEQIELRFRPAWLTPMLLGSGLGIAMTLLLGALGWRASRQSDKPSAN